MAALAAFHFLTTSGVPTSPLLHPWRSEIIYDCRVGGAVVPGVESQAPTYVSSPILSRMTPLILRNVFEDF